MIGQGQLNLLLVSQYWSDIHIVPLSGQRLLHVTCSPIKWNSALAGILTNAKCNWLICSQFEIEFCHIIIHQLLHLLNYPYWDSKCQVKAHWQFEASACSDVVLTTYRTTRRDIHGLCTAVYHANAREVTLFLEQVTRELIPMCTCSVLIE